MRLTLRAAVEEISIQIIRAGVAAAGMAVPVQPAL
jgi:hypothetical protein